MSEPLPRIECFLIGAPGAKKTETALAFEEATRDWFEERGVAPLSVIDANRDLATKQGRVSGRDGDHYSTLANFFNRAAIEDRIRLRGDSFVSVGCIIDSIAHLNVRLKTLSKMIQTTDTEGMAQREILVGNLLQTYLMDGRWNFNFVWYVPLPEQILIPGGSDNTYAYDAEVDAVLRDLNIKMQLGVPVLSGTIDERVEKMIADLNKYYVGTKVEFEEERRIISAGDGGSGLEG